MTPIVLSVDISGDPRSIPSYVPSVNPSKDSNEHRVRTLQEERRKTLEQVKSLENNITSGDIKEDEAAQLQELYIIKLKYGIFMLETNENNFLEKKNLT